MMSKACKIWMIVAAVLIILGATMFAIAMTSHNWNFTKLNTQKYETNTYIPDGEFHNIRIDTGVSNVTFLPSEDSNCRVKCYEPPKEKHTVSIEDGTLSVRLVNEKEWYDYIGVNIGTPTVTVYLPLAQYRALTVRMSTGNVTVSENFTFDSIDITASTGDVKVLASATDAVKIKTSTGAIEVANISAGTLDLSVSTGKVTVSSVACAGDISLKVSTGKAVLTDVSCHNLSSTGNTGDLRLKNVVGSGAFSIERSSGDVTFDGCDAAELTILTDTGDVTGTLLSAKVFIRDTDTGRVELPETTTGGKCKITTDTGDIKIRIQS